MSKKIKILKENECLNSNPRKVKDDLFNQTEFFDPNDLLQVKYEMLRRVEKDGVTVTNAASNFGFSRRHFYELKKQYDEGGIVSLTPRKRGPKQSHKITNEILIFIKSCLDQQQPPNSKKIAKKILDRFEIKIHQRTIERAIEKEKKNDNHKI